MDSAGQAGRVDKGDWGGLAVIGASSVGGVLSGVCPEVARGKAGGTAWWCSGSTYRGTIAHELGHTWGLPHPDAFHAGFRCADSTAYSIMQCHWEWARERLLDYEIVISRVCGSSASTRSRRTRCSRARATASYGSTGAAAGPATSGPAC